jgi:hypothetical protein
MPALAVNANLFQARADLGAGLAVFLGQAQAQGAVGVAKLEVSNQLRMVQTARPQVPEPAREAAGWGRLFLMEERVGGVLQRIARNGGRNAQF